MTLLNKKVQLLSIINIILIDIATLLPIIGTIIIATLTRGEEIMEVNTIIIATTSIVGSIIIATVTLYFSNKNSSKNNGKEHKEQEKDHVQLKVEHNLISSKLDDNKSSLKETQAIAASANETIKKNICSPKNKSCNHW